MGLDTDTTEVIIIITEQIIMAEVTIMVEIIRLVHLITKAKVGVLNLLLLKKMYAAGRIEVQPH
tara:strand:+ start:88 stop:279 length:192 start_codon:yes stop_codon:yes gene_type:complete